MQWKSWILAALTVTAMSCSSRPLYSESIAAAADNESTKVVGNYKKLNDTSYLIVLQPGAKLFQSLVAFQAATGIKSGSLTGVGVTRNTTLGFYKFNEDGQPGKTHTDDIVKNPREVVSLTCLFTTKIVDTSKPEVPAPPHCHIALAGNDDPAITGKGWNVVGGHLIEAEVAVTAELIVTTFPTEVIKRPSDIFSGFLIDLGLKQGSKELRVSAN